MPLSNARPALLLAVALGCVPAGCTRAPQAASAPSPSPAATAAGTSVPITITSRAQGNRYVTLTQSVLDHGRQRRQYDIRALSQEAVRTADGSTAATLEQPHIVFRSADGKTLVANAPRATVTTRTKDVFMSGGVHAQTDSGTVLTCRTLRYDGRTERLHGDGDVHVIMPSPDDSHWHMDGDRIDANVRLDQVRITTGNAR
jgi:hypothetical protein